MHVVHNGQSPKQPLGSCVIIPFHTWGNEDSNKLATLSKTVQLSSNRVALTIRPALMIEATPLSDPRLAFSLWDLWCPRVLVSKSQIVSQAPGVAIPGLAGGRGVVGGAQKT